MTDKTILVALMLANNEIGTIHPIDEIGAVVKAEGRALLRRRGAGRRARFRSTSTSAKVDLAAISAHKMYGPKGVGALYVRRKPRVRLVAQIDGGGHERGMRSGTLNVPGIVGFGKAAELREARDGDEAKRSCAALRDRLQRQLSARTCTKCYINGSLGAPAAGQPQRLLRLRRGRGADDGDQGRGGVVGLGVHLGVARAVVRAARARRRRGAGAHSIRFGLGRFNTEEEVDYVADHVVEAVNAAARDVAAVGDGARRAST